MNNRYYIDVKGAKDGPHDLVTLMRRIRAQKIGPDTAIFIDENNIAIRASDVPDLQVFFSHKIKSRGGDDAHAALFSLRSILRDGWRFASEHNIMTVVAGGVILICIELVALSVATLGVVVGGIASWVAFTMLHYFYFIFSLRLLRGQNISSEFINRQLSPTMSKLALASIVIGLMTAGGFILLLIPALLVKVHYLFVVLFILLIVPALLVTVYYVFVPFFIFDRRLSVIEAMHASRLLLKKFDQRYQRIVALLLLAYAASIIMIIPIPLTMPIFTAALIKIYEELSIS